MNNSRESTAKQLADINADIIRELQERIAKERGQFEQIMDCVSHPSYIASIQSDKILFENASLKKLMKKSVLGEKCCKALQGLDYKYTFRNTETVQLNILPALEKKNLTNNRWYRYHATLIDWHGERAKFVLAIDIHEKKHTEALLRAIVGYSPYGIAVTYPDGGIYMINDRFAKKFGYTKEKMLNMNTRQFYLYPEQGRVYLEQHKNDTFQYTTDYVDKEGKQITLTLESRRVENGDLKFINYIVNE